MAADNELQAQGASEEISDADLDGVAGGTGHHKHHKDPHHKDPHHKHHHHKHHHHDDHKPLISPSQDNTPSASSGASSGWSGGRDSSSEADRP